MYVKATGWVVHDMLVQQTTEQLDAAGCATPH